MPSNGLRRYIKFSLPVLIAASGYLGYEGLLLRMEAAAFQSGHYDEAARLAGPVALMRRSLTEQLRAQLAELDAKGATGAQLPLLEKLYALAPDPELGRRLAAARLLVAPADALSLQGLLLQPREALAEPAGPEARFRALPVPGKQTPWGSLCRLALREPDGSWREVGEGFFGPLGASFELLRGGEHALVAGDEALERWDLTSGQLTAIATVGAPQFLAARPHREEVAYSVADAAGDVLYLWQPGESRRLYPLEGQPPMPWLGFKWAPDGQSLWVCHEEPPSAAGAEPGTHLVWLSAEGEVLLEATLDVPLAELEPEWLASPDGRRMALTAGEGAWIWTAGEPAPVTLAESGMLLGFSADGSKLAALDGRRLAIFDVASPHRRAEREFPELPAVFEPADGGFAWKGDRLELAGRAAESAHGPFVDVAIAVPVALRTPSASPAAP